MAHQHIPYSMHYMPTPTNPYLMTVQGPQAQAAHPHAHAHAHIHHGHMQAPSHLVPATGPIRSEMPPQRKRPKYTRSKTGCLTCRGKKIKCDETKPNCTRCTNGQRDCVWPEPAPAAKKQKTPRKTASTEEGNTGAGAESASRSSGSGSSTSRDASPNSRDQDSAQSQSPTLTDERRHSIPSYSYLDHNAPSSRSQTGGSASQTQTPQGTPPLTLNSVAELGPSYAAVSSSYDFKNGSPHGTTSSPGNSRPSTANSGPSAHYSAPPMPTVDAREYSRWGYMEAPRPEAYATAAYYA